MKDLQQPNPVFSVGKGTEFWRKHATPTEEVSVSLFQTLAQEHAVQLQ